MNRSMPNASVAAKLTPVLRPDAPNPIGVCVVCARVIHWPALGTGAR
ncbi:MAG: hypothetical protein ACJ8MR_08760 [Povalibacter sp.]